MPMAARPWWRSTCPGAQVWARIWTIHVGRVSLYLLDSNLDQNSPADRQLTARLYSNDPEIRIPQEMMLGIGGVRALRLLGYNPAIWHMNEGHSAFLVLERILELVTKGMPFDKAAAKRCARPISLPRTPPSRRATTSSRCG